MEEGGEGEMVVAGGGADEADGERQGELGVGDVPSVKRRMRCPLTPLGLH